MRNLLVLALFLALAAFVLADKDYYKILGVSRQASQKEIKKSYRDLSLKYHPGLFLKQKKKKKDLEKLNCFDFWNWLFVIIDL